MASTQYESTGRLPDGGAVAIRPIRASDAPALASAYARLGERSRYRRFLSAARRLPARELRYLTAVDHHCHEALVALDPRSEEIVGVARYVRLPGRLDEAELAEEVVDGWQRRGVGRLLLGAITGLARADGIERFRAVVASENVPVHRALRRLGASSHAVDGEVEYLVELGAITTSGIEPPSEGALR